MVLPGCGSKKTPEKLNGQLMAAVSGDKVNRK
jgi:hypothetical protein